MYCGVLKLITQNIVYFFLDIFKKESYIHFLNLLLISVS